MTQDLTSKNSVFHSTNPSQNNPHATNMFGCTCRKYDEDACYIISKNLQGLDEKIFGIE